MSAPKIGQYKVKSKTTKVKSLTSTKWGCIEFKYADGRNGCLVGFCSLSLDSGMKPSDIYGHQLAEHKKLFNDLGQLLKNS